MPPPKPFWGAMIADGRGYLTDAWWIAFFPGVAIFLVVMALKFLADWMRDRLDPRLRQLRPAAIRSAAPLPVATSASSR